MSMQEFLRAHLIDLTARPSATDALAQVRSRARAYPRLSYADLVDALGARPSVTGTVVLDASAAVHS